MQSPVFLAFMCDRGSNNEYMHIHQSLDFSRLLEIMKISSNISWSALLNPGQPLPSWLALVLLRLNSLTYVWSPPKSERIPILNFVPLETNILRCGMQNTTMEASHNNPKDGLTSPQLLRCGVQDTSMDCSYNNSRDGLSSPPMESMLPEIFRMARKSSFK